MLGRNLQAKVSTIMVIDWKEEENYTKRSELIIMNSSKNGISDHKFTIILTRKRFEDKRTLLY
jgi:hypothetical protein